jgi:hypothetical protein
MKKPNPSNGEMLIRSFNALHCAKGLREQVAKTLETNPALNECFLADPESELPVLGGFNLRGDIRMSLSGKGRSQKMTFFFRRGDRQVYEALCQDLGYTGKPIVDGKVGLPRLAEMMSRNPELAMIGKVIVSDAAIDAAMQCTFSETDQIIEFSVGIHSLSGKIARDLVCEEDRQLGSEDSGIDPGPIRMTLHRGRKVRLDQRAILLGRRHDTHLVVHFTWLPRERAILIGWFSEVVMA